MLFGASSLTQERPSDISSGVLWRVSKLTYGMVAFAAVIVS